MIKGGGDMAKARAATAARIRELTKARNLKIPALGEASGLPPSTIYSILDGKSSNPGITSIEAICKGLDVSICEFFNSPLFR